PRSSDAPQENCEAEVARQRRRRRKKGRVCACRSDVRQAGKVPVKASAHRGHSQPNVPAISSAYTSPSIISLNVTSHGFEYQHESLTCAKPNARNAAVPATRKIAR